MRGWVLGMVALTACREPGPSFDKDSGSDSAMVDTVDSARVDDTDVDPHPRPVRRRDFSPPARALWDSLHLVPASEFVTWNTTGDAVFETDWVMQTPEADHWGRAADAIGRWSGDAAGRTQPVDPALPHHGTGP